MTLLELSGVKAFYGSSQALFDVNFTVGDGEVIALMGRNGMGKTTTIKSICRMIPAVGLLRFAGHDLSVLPSHSAAQLGIGLVPEGRRCFANLTVEENLVAAARRGHWNLDTVGILFPRLTERRNQMAGSLSGGEQQMLAIGRALMTNPRLLILDEATEGLAPIIRQEIWKAIRILKQETAMAILVVDKSLKELANIADRVVIMQRGESVWSGTLSDLKPEVSNALIGI